MPWAAIETTSLQNFLFSLQRTAAVATHTHTTEHISGRVIPSYTNVRFVRLLYTAHSDGGPRFISSSNDGYRVAVLPTQVKKKRLEIHLLLYFTVLVFIILQPNIILLLVKVRVRTYRSKGRFLSLVACIMCFFLPTGFYLRRSFTSSFFLLLLLLLLLCCYFFFLI